MKDTDLGEMEKDNRHLLKEVEKYRTLLEETEKSNDFLKQKASMRDEQVYQLQLELQRVGTQTSASAHQMLADITHKQEERREASAERRRDRELSHGNGTGRGHGGQPYSNHDFGQQGQAKGGRPQSRQKERNGSKGTGRR